MWCPCIFLDCRKIKLGDGPQFIRDDQGSAGTRSKDAENLHLSDIGATDSRLGRCALDGASLSGPDLGFTDTAIAAATADRECEPATVRVRQGISRISFSGDKRRGEEMLHRAGSQPPTFHLIQHVLADAAAAVAARELPPGTGRMAA